MFDAAPNATMNSLTGWVKESLQETSSFWSSSNRESRFIELLDLAGISLRGAYFYGISFNRCPQVNPTLKPTEPSALSLLY
jgi:hypothetical protein